MPEAQLLKLPMAGLASCGQHGRMHDMDALQSQDLRGLTPQALEALAQRMLVHVQQQAREIARRDGEIVWRDAKIEKITFELARLKRWKFGARTEAMDAQQRQLFLDTLVEDEADLQAQLAALQARQSPPPVTPEKAPQPPRRQALPEHLRRVEHHHEPADTHCPAVDCGEPMTRVGEDVSERLDIVPAEFFVHRHIRGKWVCRCCQRQGVDRLVQEPAEPQIIERGIPASGLVAYTLISRFADHVPYYRQEAINARSGVHTPRSTLAAWAGQAGAALHPLYEALKRFVLGSAVVQADETTVDMLDPGAGKTRKAYVWAYARGEFDPRPGVVYDFCPGRGSKYPLAFLGGLPSPPGSQADRPAESRDPPWSGTLVCDRYGGYDSVLDPKVFPQRVSAACAAHARRKFDELAKSGKSTLATQAIVRFAAIYHAEKSFAGMDGPTRTQARQRIAAPLWQELHTWLKLERGRVADGGATANAIDYSLNHWPALTRHLLDGAVPVDNNHLERQIKPWAMGRKAWLFCGSELAGQRAAVVMSLVQSAKLNGLEPWAYLRDVLDRLPTHLNSRIDDLLPHRWQPPQIPD